MAPSTRSGPPSSPDRSPTLSSTRYSAKIYSRRAQLHAKKRKAELADETSGTEGSEGEILGQGERNVHKRNRQNSASPSPQKRRTGPPPQVRDDDDAVSAQAISTKEGEMESESTINRTPRSGRQISKVKLRSPEKNPDPIQAQESDTPSETSPPKPISHQHAPTTPKQQRAGRLLSHHSSPRDLSAIFSPDSKSDAAPNKNIENSPSSMARRSGGLRRMLTKAQSMGDALASPSTRHERDGSPSREFHPSSGPSTPRKDLTRTLSLPASPFDSPSRTGTTSHAPEPEAEKSKRTYGKNRTYLEERQETQVMDNIGLGAQDDKDMVTSESYAELRKRFEVDNTFQSGSNSPGGLMQAFLQAKAPQPVSDMRSKGENRRYLDELAYLTEGIADPSTSITLKRSSCVEILRNMQDEDWVAKLNICGQSERIWEVLMIARGEGDEVLDIICLLYLVLLDHSAIGLDGILQSHAPECVPLALRYMQTQVSILERDAGSQTSLVRKIKVIVSSIGTLWSSSTPTARRLAAHLATQLSKDEYWKYTQPHLGTIKGLSQLTGAIISELETPIERFDLYEKGMAMLIDPMQFDIDYLASTLHCLSDWLMKFEENPDEYVTTHPSLPTCLLQGISACANLVFDKDARRASIAARCIISSVQIVACIANISSISLGFLLPKLGELKALIWVLLQRQAIVAAVLHDPTANIDKRPSAADKVEDILCLVLAILTTQLVNDSTLTKSMSALTMSAKCEVRHACIFTCRCDDIVPVSQHLVRLFARYSTAMEEQNGLIISGYLALLLSKLVICEQGGSTTEVTLGLLPGSTTAEKLSPILHSLKELEGVHSIVQRNLGDEEADAPRMAHTTLCTAINDLEEYMR